MAFKRSSVRFRLAPPLNQLKILMFLCADQGALFLGATKGTTAEPRRHVSRRFRAGGLVRRQQGFLAADTQLGFNPVRRLGRQVPAYTADKHRLGLVFTAASPRGSRNLITRPRTYRHVPIAAPRSSQASAVL